MNIKQKIKQIRFLYYNLIQCYEIYALVRENVLLFWDFLMRYLSWQPKVLSISETINYIKIHNCSVARFGDGEMKLINGHPIKFQVFDELLSSSLAHILETDSNHKLLVCIPDTFANLGEFEPSARKYWRHFMAHNRANWKRLLHKNIIYGNAFISRPYMIFKDKSKARNHIDCIMSIWENRHILVIEGEYSRLGVGNDLFKFASSVTRILCPNNNAWHFKNEILNHISKFSKDYIILLALGPTATVLATDLSELGYLAIDIGHIDVELEWLNLNASTKVPIIGKEVNEASTTEPIGDCLDPSYANSISTRIGE